MSSELGESLLSIKRVLETDLVLDSKAISVSEVQHGSFATLLLGDYAVPTAARRSTINQAIGSALLVLRTMYM